MRAKEFINEANYGCYWCSTDKRWKYRKGPKQSRRVKESINEHAPGKQVVQAILEVMPAAKEIWFHGSRATGKHRKDSDTDILVVVSDDVVGEDYLDAVHTLQSVAATFHNYDIQPTKQGTNIHRIAQEEGRLLWQQTNENFADGEKKDQIASAETVLSYVKKKHHNFKANNEILMYPNWRLELMPLEYIIVADEDDTGIDRAQVARVIHDTEKNINQLPIVVDTAGAIIDGNHRAFAAKELGMTHIPAWRPVDDDLIENFADGKNPGRKGLAKRMGVDCSQSVSKLRKIAKNSTGEKQRMAHWCANMKAGKK